MEISVNEICDQIQPKDIFCHVKSKSMAQKHKQMYPKQVRQRIEGNLEVVRELKAVPSLPPIQRESPILYAIFYACLIAAIQ